MKLSEHFDLSEMIVSQTALRQGIDNTPSPTIVANLRKTAALLEEVRGLLGTPLLITSGYRCPALNVAVGGVVARNPDGTERLSAHTAGQAADFHSPAFGSPKSIAIKLAGTPGLAFDQLIYEFGAWVHIAWADSPRHQVLTIDGAGARWGL